MSVLYLISDGTRIVRLAVEQSGKIYGYVPNVKAFVYSRAATIDFSVEHELTYTPIAAEDAATIIKVGKVGKIDARSAAYRLTEARNEPQKLDPAAVLREHRYIEPEPTPTQIAHTKARAVLAAAPGEWISYKTYPATARHLARQLASDLRRGQVKAFAALPITARVVTTEAGDSLVQISRQVDNE